MTGRHGKTPERWKPSETHADSSSQYQTGGDVYQWQAQQTGGDAPRGTPQTELSSREYKQQLIEMDERNTARTAWFDREPPGNRIPIPTGTRLDKRALEARYRQDAIKRGKEEYQARVAEARRFDTAEQAQIIQEQLEKFKQTELARRAELERQAQLADLAREAELVRQAQQVGLPSQAELAQQADLAQAQAGSARPPELTSEQQAQPLLYAPEPVWQAQPPEFNPAHQPQPPFNLEPVWPAPQPELTPEQQARQEQYLLEQQAQHALEQMRQGQPPYPEYPGQGGGFQQ
jgi:hypothetical protein